MRLFPRPKSRIRQEPPVIQFKGLNGVHWYFTYLGLIEVLWGFQEFQIRSLLYKDSVFYQVKVTTWQIFEQTESSKWCDHISSYGHLRSWENKHQAFFLFFSEGPKRKSVSEWFIDPKDVLRHSFSWILSSISHTAYISI